MVKKYKLIRSYPNSPKLGSVIVDTNPGNGAKDAWFEENWGKIGKLSFLLPKSFKPEDYPEFWEEVKDSTTELLEEAAKRYPKGTRYIAANRVGYTTKELIEGISTGKFNVIEYTTSSGTKMFHITSEDNKSVYLNGVWADVVKEEIKEKDYEILSFRTPQNTKMYVGRSILGTWYVFSEVAKQNFYRDDEWMIRNGYIINSIKRLSDGEVFTLGDAVQLNCGDGYWWEYADCIISKFVENNSSLTFRIKQDALEASYPNLLEKWRKVKKPLFITEDGKEIFDGDKTFGINENFEPLYTNSFEWRKGQNPNKLHKHFSTKEAAQKWIDENKPVYSKADISKALLDPGGKFWQDAYFRLMGEEL